MPPKRPSRARSPRPRAPPPAPTGPVVDVFSWSYMTLQCAGIFLGAFGAGMVMFFFFLLKNASAFHQLGYTTLWGFALCVAGLVILVLNGHYADGRVYSIRLRKA